MSNYWAGFCNGLGIGLMIAGFAVLIVRSKIYQASRLKEKYEGKEG